LGPFFSHSRAIMRPNCVLLSIQTDLLYCEDLRVTGPSFSIIICNDTAWGTSN
jgi:hypothetical protein